MAVVRASARSTKQAPASNFTGTVYSDEIVVGTTPSRMRASVVSFTPGARTAWHTHPVGQTLYCLSGVGRICFKGEKPQALNPGDTVMIPPGVQHWHGAAPDRLFAHMAMSENSDSGAGTSWGEHVSDADYNTAVG
ncbi:MAG TPA: cupin domain-containing protein [Acetobacteraceae bacterium]|jgi:quercetin dioxygenase-like cupin family protein|nr:cupin domain-containing protein [Acetobacteraceae bacterium]